MEAEAVADPKIAMVDWSSETNWSIASGSLRDRLTFQSSLSLFDADGRELEPTTVDSTSKSPLILHPPSPDSAPCEISINFSEKHELRQVYVRSTARVYEIYYAPNLQSNNEYLCTVRCGVAARDGEVLRAPNIQELASSTAEGSNKELGEENMKSEDDWVEVKVPDSPVLDGRNIPLQTKSLINSAKNSQDFFEATAEINDANPCISVTLRLLSLQNKSFICVDEIYVFGDPVDSDDSESQESHNENSSGKSLMAMFLPTLMQLSKTTGLSHLNAVRNGKQRFSEDDLEETDPSDSVIKTQLKGKASITDRQEVKLKDVNGCWVGPCKLDTLSQAGKMESNDTAVPSQAGKMESNHSIVPSQIAETENSCSVVPFQIPKMECNRSAVPKEVATKSNHGDSLSGNVESALEQLVTRMDRIEEICLGFQEKMIMPMSSIEARLQRVEQQLDTLTKKLQNSALPSYYRISAPDASCIESDANSCDNCHGNAVTSDIESDKKELHREVPSVSPDDMSNSANTTQLPTGLVVKAPEFTDGEDEEDNVSGQEMNSSNDEVKQSIDDALSCALANFVSSLSMDSPKYTKSLTVKAPEFSNEDDDDHESNETEKNDSVPLTDSEKINHVRVLTSSNISLESGGKVNRDSNDKQSRETAREAEECGQFCRGDGDQEGMCVKATTVAEHSRITGFHDNFEEDEKVKINGQKSDGLSSNISDISNELLDNQATTPSSIIQEGQSARTDLMVATEVPTKASHEDIIENVLGFSLASSVVDFEIPLLDVEFISHRSPVTKPFLEALLVETPETNSNDPSVRESSDDLPIEEQLKSNSDLSVEEHSNLVSVDDGELVNSASDSHLAVDKDYCTLMTVPMNNEGDNLPEDHRRKRDQVSTSSLI